MRGSEAPSVDRIRTAMTLWRDIFGAMMGFVVDELICRGQNRACAVTTLSSPQESRNLQVDSHFKLWRFLRSLGFLFLETPRAPTLFGWWRPGLIASFVSLPRVILLLLLITLLFLG